MDAKDLIILELQEFIQRLEKRIDQLEGEVRILKNRKNSGNSSLPPSSDLSGSGPKPNQSLRKPSDKPSGGQTGHEGSTLAMTQTPDFIEKLMPTHCQGCQRSLKDAPPLFVSRRQVVDIPPVHSFYTEYQQFEKTCPCCDLRQMAHFPSHVKAPIQYGPNVMSTLAYLYSRQFVPLKRSKELMNSLFGLSLSEGTIVNLLEKIAQKALPVYELIRQQIIKSGYAGADETGCKVNGKTHWFWTMQNRENTFIWSSKSRGFDALNQMFSDSLNDHILVHDCWAAYFKTKARAHQLCLAHIARDLEFLAQLYPKEKWVKAIKAAFSVALRLKREMEVVPSRSWLKERTRLESRLKTWIQKPLQNAGKEVIKLQKRLIKHCMSMTVFLHHYHIPADNNGSERAIRNVKVKQKVSGQFKSEKGAVVFAIIRSVVDSMIKTQKDVFTCLSALATLQPE